jgi:hypothetical protein
MQMHLPARGLVAALALSLLAVACGGNPAQTAPGPTTSPPAQPTQVPAAATNTPSASSTAAAGAGVCALVPGAVVSQAVGQAVDGGESTESQLLGRSCRYRATGSDMVIDLGLNDFPDVAAWDERMSTAMSDGQPFVGLGEKALIADGAALGGPGVRLFAYSSGQGLLVTISGAGDQAQMRAAAEMFARLLLQGL